MLFFLVNKKLVWSHNRYISFYKILFISSQNNINFCIYCRIILHSVFQIVKV